MKVANTKFYKLVFWTYIVIISYLAFFPHTSSSIPNIDKVKHCLAFIVFAFLVQKSYKVGNLLTMFYVVLFGAFIEVVQLFIPYRNADIFDLLADVIGGLIAILTKKLITLYMVKNEKLSDLDTR
ncbi:MAG: VanZ family protein [Thermodesulfobacteria bacterium]|nr:VanZ family protein [Thermodesulfobacteriota bacterium]